MARPRIDRTLKLYKSKNVSITFSGSLVDSFKDYIAKVEDEAIRPAAYAGARLLYQAMRQNVPVKSGKLHESIYHWFNTKASTAHKSVYTIGPNKGKAQHWYNVEYGHWLYNRYANGRWLRSKSNKNRRGPSAHDIPSGRLLTPQWVAGDRYIDRTWEQNKDAAVAAMKRRFAEKVKEIKP